MNKEADISLLEKYLAGEIRADEVLDLDGQVLTAGELELAVDEYQDVKAHLEGVALKADLQERFSGTQAPKEKKGYTRWLVAAIVVLLLTFGFLWQNRDTSPELEDYFSHFPQLETFRGEGPTVYSQALEAYTLRNYKKALKLFSEIENPEKEAQFFMGVSALATGNAELAVEALQRAGVDLKNRYYQQTRWYLALAYWQVGNLPEARRYLESIPKEEYNFEEAQKLLSVL